MWKSWSIKASKVKIFWEGRKIWKNLPLYLTLLGIGNVKKIGRFFFQIFWPNQNIWTLQNSFACWHSSKNKTCAPVDFFTRWKTWVCMENESNSPEPTSLKAQWTLNNIDLKQSSNIHISHCWKCFKLWNNFLFG